MSRERGFIWVGGDWVCFPPKSICFPLKQHSEIGVFPEKA